ncbi:MAG: hypothetical protein FWD47_06225 [Treponema sp.]|nr:hypothetical protein [Treponema sp.]
MKINYRVKLHDFDEFIFSYVDKVELNRCLSSKDWIIEEELQYKYFSCVYSGSDEYIAYFPEKSNRKDYGLYCNEKMFFKRIRENRLIFFNPDDDFSKIHYMELLSKHEIDYLKKLHDLELFEIDGLANIYNEHFKLDDNRILVIRHGVFGELFMDINELFILIKWEQG